MKVEIFDPPMCCSSGVCGPAVDPALVRFAADLDGLKGKVASRGLYPDRQTLAAFAGIILSGKDLLACL